MHVSAIMRVQASASNSNQRGGTCKPLVTIACATDSRFPLLHTIRPTIRVGTANSGRKSALRAGQINIQGAATGGSLLEGERLITLEQSVENAQLLRAVWRRGRGEFNGRQGIEDLARADVGGRN